MAKRYQKGNHNLYIEEEQTTQWPKDTKGAIIICISKKNRQHNGQKKKYKRTKFGNRAQHSVPCRRTANSQFGYVGKVLGHAELSVGC
jgi:hypothetical protein